MNLLILPLLFVGAVSVPVTTDPRCKVLTYGCQDLRTARDCGIVSDCIKDFWSTIGVPTVKNEICDLCKKMVEEAREQLLSNMTQEEIKEVFEGSCKLLPTALVKDACIKIVDEFIPELIEMLASRMDPGMVCTVAGLCFGEKGPEIYEKTSCEKCVSVTTGLKKFTTIISKEMFKDHILDKCIYDYENTREECEALLGNDLDKIYDYVETMIPQDTCGQLSLCDNGGNLKAPLKDLGDNMTCEFCESMVHYLQNLLASKSLKEEIRTALNNMCATFGQFGNECKDLIKEYFDEAYDMFVNELDPQKVCTTFGLCDKFERPGAVPDYLPFHKFDIHEEKNEISSDSSNEIECEVCKKVIEYVKDAVTDPKNEEEIREALDKVCDYLPSSLTSKCQEFVNTYADMVIALLAEEMDPEHICEALKLCPAGADLQPKISASPDECEICQLIVTEIQKLLQNDEIDKDITNLFEKVCKIFPQTSRPHCRSVVEDYGPYILQMLSQLADSQQICTDISLCASSENLLGRSKCTLGPAFWCANRAQAKACHAERYCEEKGWSQQN